MMRRSFAALAFAGALALPATRAAAQAAPAAPPHDHMAMMGGMMAAHNAAQAFLSHTAELKLTDQQVVKLAAIARRVDAMHKSMMAKMDSMHAAMGRGDSAMRQPMMPPAQMQQMHDQMMTQVRTDVKDALAVLTPDQLADAWIMVVSHAHAGPAGHGMPGHGMQGPPPDGAQRMGPRPGGPPPAVNR